MATKRRVIIGGLSAAVLALASAGYNHWEGRNYTAVHLPFDPPGVITVCGGITTHDIPTLKVGDKYTESECLGMIAKVIPRYAAPVQACIPSFNEMPPHRQAAMILFSINLGPGVACGKVASLLNAGRVNEACNKMSEYVFANGKYLKGLDNRRNDPVWGEKTWCLRED
ncbi:lysozyme [Bradyrhizobium sp. 5.13L]